MRTMQLHLIIGKEIHRYAVARAHLSHSSFHSSHLYSCTFHQIHWWTLSHHRKSTVRHRQQGLAERIVSKEQVCQRGHSRSLHSLYTSLQYSAMSHAILIRIGLRWLEKSCQMLLFSCRQLRSIDDTLSLSMWILQRWVPLLKITSWAGSYMLCLDKSM